MDRYGSPKCTETCHYHLGGGLKHLLFPSLFVQMIQFDFRIFFRWVESNHQLVIHIVHTQKEWKCMFYKIFLMTKVSQDFVTLPELSK